VSLYDRVITEDEEMVEIVQTIKKAIKKVQTGVRQYKRSRGEGASRGTAAHIALGHAKGRGTAKGRERKAKRGAHQSELVKRMQKAEKEGGAKARAKAYRTKVKMCGFRPCDPENKGSMKK
jgi:hypothetical protein